jgi:transcriptional regulator with XRE-family HTH domain
LKRLRILAGLSQRAMAKLLKVNGAHLGYLENDRRRPSGALILRYRKLEKRLLVKIKADGVARAKFVNDRSRNRGLNASSRKR